MGSGHGGSELRRERGESRRRSQWELGREGHGKTFSKQGLPGAGWQSSGRESRVSVLGWPGVGVGGAAWRRGSGRRVPCGASHLEEDWGQATPRGTAYFSKCAGDGFLSFGEGSYK